MVKRIILLAFIIGCFSLTAMEDPAHSIWQTLDSETIAALISIEQEFSREINQVNLDLFEYIESQDEMQQGLQHHTTPIWFNDEEKSAAICYDNHPFTTQIAHIKNKESDQAATILQRYIKKYLDKPPCSICLDHNANYKIACGHNFHQKCISKWLEHHDSCPICRAECVK